MPSSPTYDTPREELPTMVKSPRSKLTNVESAVKEVELSNQASAADTASKADVGNKDEEIKVITSRDLPLPVVVTHSGYLGQLYYFSFFGADTVLERREEQKQNEGSTKDKNKVANTDSSDAKYLLGTLIVGLVTLAGTSYVNFRTSAILRDVIDSNAESATDAIGSAVNAGLVRRSISGNASNLTDEASCPWTKFFTFFHEKIPSKAIASASFFLLGSVCSSLRTKCFHSLKERIKVKLCDRIFAAMVANPKDGAALLAKGSGGKNGAFKVNVKSVEIGRDIADKAMVRVGREMKPVDAGGKDLGKDSGKDNSGKKEEGVKSTTSLGVNKEASGEWTNVDSTSGNVEILEDGSPIKKQFSQTKNDISDVSISSPSDVFLSSLELTCLKLTRRVIVVESPAEQKKLIQKLKRVELDRESMTATRFIQSIEKQQTDSSMKQLEMLEKAGESKKGEAKNGESKEASGNSTTDTNTTHLFEDGPSGAEQRFAILKHDADIIATFFANKCQNYIRYCCSVLGGTYISFRQCPKLAMVVHPIIFILTMYGVRRSKSKTVKQKESEIKVDNFARQRLVFPSVVRGAFLDVRDALAFRGRGGLLNSALLESEKAAARQGKLMGIVDVGIKASLLGAAYSGAAMVRRSQLSSGVLTQFLLHTALLALGCYGLLNASDDYKQAVESAGRVAQVLEAGPSVAGFSLLAGTLSSSSPSNKKNKTNDGSSTLLSLENMNYRYPETSRLLFGTAGINLALKRGEMWAVLGPSGVGKTTLLNLLLGEKRPSLGNVKFGGGVSVSADEEQGDGEVSLKTRYLPQQLGLIGETPEDIVAYFSSQEKDNQQSDSSDSDETIQKLLSHLDLTLPPSAPVTIKSGKGKNAATTTLLSHDQYSGGEKQRLALARSLYKINEDDTDLLLLDEPTGALDRRTEQKALEAIKNGGIVDGERDSSDRKYATIIVTHSNAVVEMCDRFLVLEKEGVVQINSLKELKKDPVGDGKGMGFFI